MQPVNINQCLSWRRIYTTFILGTALLNFGTRANNTGHGTLDFCRVKANFSARVPKNLDGLRPPQEVVPARLKRGPRAETRGNLVPRVFALTTLPRKRRLWGRKWAMGRQNLVLFAWRKMASKNSKNSGTIRISWSNDAIDMFIDLWSEETIQFALENSKTSKETREVYSTVQVNNTFYLIQQWPQYDARFERLWGYRVVDRCRPETNLNHTFSSFSSSTVL